MEVIEAKRRLLEHTQETRRTGGPHQQPLINDIDTLLIAHTEAVEQIGELEQQVALVTANNLTLLDERNAALDAAAATPRIASTEGKSFADIRADLAKGPESA
jgi:hypothetical protein